MEQSIINEEPLHTAKVVVGIKRLVSKKGHQNQWEKKG